jgi:hypothetical protein
MFTIRLDPDRLSTEELANLAIALHERCADCIECNVPHPCAHQNEVHEFLDAVACAVDQTLRDRERWLNAQALGVDDSTGEWLGGA